MRNYLSSSDAFAEHLKHLGWKDTGDAQWHNIAQLYDELQREFHPFDEVNCIDNEQAFITFIEMENNVEYQSDKLNERLQRIHTMRCQAYMDNTVKFTHEWGYVTKGGDGKEFSICSGISFNGYTEDKKEIRLDRTQYNRGDADTIYTNLANPIPVAFLWMSNEEVTKFYTEEALAKKAVQNKVKVANDTKKLNQLKEEAAIIQASIDTLNKELES